MNQEIKKEPDTKGSTGPNSPVDDIADFLNRDHGEELSEFKEYMNDGLGILVTIDDEESGIPLHLFLQGEDSSVLTKRLEKLDKEKRRSIRALLAWLEGFENMANKAFSDYKAYLTQRIDSIKTNAETNIEALGQTISKLKKTALGSTKAGKEMLKTAEKKKSRMKDLIERLSKHSEKVESADDTKELLDIETEMEQDVVEYDKKISFGRIKKGLGAFFTGLSAGAPVIEETFTELENDQFDVFEELDIDPLVPSFDEEEEDDSGTASETHEEELSY